MNVFHKPFLEWTFCVKPSQVSVKFKWQPFVSVFFSRFNQSFVYLLLNRVSVFFSSCILSLGMGKTAVFVLATLQQLEPTENHTYVLVMCHTRELAFQISKEYERFSKYMPALKVGVFFGGLPIQKDEETLKTMTPHIVVGTPGRILALIRNKKLNFKHLKHFILDECDKMLEQLGKFDNNSHTMPLTIIIMMINHR